tara:strand:+ start:560 stop:1864 length:1305 start_codon:yes stop_codon:yes gene_type:complete
MVNWALEIGDMFQDPSGATYECRSQLATGGFGSVYLVLNQKTGTECIAKLPKLDTGKDDFIIKKQRAEGQILEDLTMKGVEGVAKFISAFESNINGTNMPVLLIEIAPGVTLKQWLATNGPMDEDGVRATLEKLATSLRDIHINGYIHRDIKSDNVFIDGDLADPVVTIIDFGISAQYDDSTLHNTGNATNLCHTPFYAPPEQRTHHDAKPSTDVFAVAAIGFELLTGYGNHPGGMESRYAPQEYAPSGAVSDDFNEVIKKASWDNPQHRYRVMDDLILALRGKPLMIHMPRIIAEKAHALEEDEIWICRRTNALSNAARIQVNEKTGPSGPYFLSRWHAVIRKGQDGIYRLFDEGADRPNNSPSTKSTNGTVWRRKATNEWRPVPEAGLPLAGKYCEIGLGFTKRPPNAKDANDQPILPGAYKTIEYAPPDQS